MKVKNLFIICLSIQMVVLSYDADAQRKKRYKRKVIRFSGSSQPYWFAGASINAGNYFGDLAPASKKASTDISFTRLGFGIFGGYKFHNSLAVRGGFNWVRVYGDDFSVTPSNNQKLLRYARNLSFRNDIKEFQLGLEVYLLPNFEGANKRKPINGYLYAGVAVFHHDPMGIVPDADYQIDPTGATPVKSAGKWVKLKPLGTEGQNLGITPSYSNFSLSIPVSIGVTLKFPNSKFNAGLEFGIRYLFTDYIDDVSKNYVNLDLLEADGGQLARIMSDKSAVPTSSQGKARDLSGIGLTNSPVHGYNTSSLIVAGHNNNVRGNPDSDDLIFMTQLKITYIVRGAVKKSIKYR